MRRFLLACAIPLFAIATTHGQNRVKDGPNRPAEEPDPALWTTKLTIGAPPAPKPLLKYELLPTARDRVPGNAAIGYQRAVIVRPEWPRDPKKSQEQHDLLDGWSATPVEQLPTGKIEAFLLGYRDLLAELDESARRTTCDWQTERMKAEDISRLLPSVQGNRETQRIVSLKSRMELGAKKFPEALRSIQTGFQMAKHVGEGSTLIEFLVGQSMASYMIGRTDEWIGRADSPNLYWAFTTLPKPFIDPRFALDGEVRFQEGFLPALKEMERGPVSEDVATTTLANWCKNLTGASGVELGGLENLAANVGVAAMAGVQGPGAKKDLLARGLAKKDVDAMPAAQAVLLRSIYRHRGVWDDQVKCFSLPPHKAFLELERIDRQAKKARTEAKDDALFAVMTLLYPAVQKVHFAHARFERRVALVRALEAVRLQIAADGAIPKSLDAVAVVAVPEDPFTGKPFEYSATATGFKLVAPPLPGYGRNMGEQVYDVTLRR
jgi:hypothetical protein